MEWKGCVFGGNVPAMAAVVEIGLSVSVPQARGISVNKFEPPKKRLI